MYLSLDAYVDNRDESLTVLAELLRSGSLALVLGAGVSRGVGLPLWHELVARLAHSVGISERITKATPVHKLLGIVEDVRNRYGDIQKYHDAVRESLYKKGGTEEDLLGHRLLAVLGAMCMRSRRGSVTEVLTFNFDDVLERYLRLHGFAAQAVVNIPSLRYDVDTTIYHPHGFLASAGSAIEDSDKSIVMCRFSIEEMQGGVDNPWNAMIKDLLYRKVALVVGLSTDQPTLMPLVAHVMPEIEKESRPTAFWITGKESDCDLLTNRNIAPIRVGHGEVERFLRDVCERALSKYERVVVT